VASKHLNLTGSARIAHVRPDHRGLGPPRERWAFAGMNPSGFNQFVAAQNGVVQMRDISANFYDTSTNGSGPSGGGRSR
jgi:hypothetical protein